MNEKKKKRKKRKKERRKQKRKKKKQRKKARKKKLSLLAGQKKKTIHRSTDRHDDILRKLKSGFVGTENPTHRIQAVYIGPMQSATEPLFS